MSATVTDFAPWMGVFETIRVIDGMPFFMAEHRAELNRAMTALGLESTADFEAGQEVLQGQSGRWRWVVGQEEAWTIFSAEPPSPSEPVALSISPVRVGSANWDARFKTVSYLSHAQAWKTSATPEAILLNEHGNVACASRANVFWRRGTRLFTPAHEAGCRCGVIRSFVLAQIKTVQVEHFSASELLQADEIFITNSMKGIVSASAIEGRKLTNFSSGDRLREIYGAALSERVKRR